MKKVICYLGINGTTVYADAAGEWMLGDIDLTGNHPVQELEEDTNPPQTAQQSPIMQLVAAGLSAEDLIKLKHGGVI